MIWFVLCLFHQCPALFQSCSVAPSSLIGFCPEACFINLSRSMFHYEIFFSCNVISEVICPNSILLIAGVIPTIGYTICVDHFSMMTGLCKCPLRVLPSIFSVSVSIRFSRCLSLVDFVTQVHSYAYKGLLPLLNQCVLPSFPSCSYVVLISFSRCSTFIEGLLPNRYSGAGSIILALLGLQILTAWSTVSVWCAMSHIVNFSRFFSYLGVFLWSIYVLWVLIIWTLR